MEQPLTRFFDIHSLLEGRTVARVASLREAESTAAIYAQSGGNYLIYECRVVRSVLSPSLNEEAKRIGE